MITLITAMYPEAAPFIERLKLKKILSFTKFQLFASEDYRLLITGTGMIKAAVAVTTYINAYPAKENDIFINIGICAGYNSALLGGLYVCSKIICESSGFTFYPDLIFAPELKNSPFDTALLITSQKLVVEYKVPNEEYKNTDIEYKNLNIEYRNSNGKYKSSNEEYRNFNEEYKNLNKEYKNLNEDMYSNILYDMEGAGIYQALSIFVHTHQLIFIKIVSDTSADKSLSHITSDYIKNLIAANADTICNYIFSLKDILLNIKTYDILFTNKQLKDIKKISELMQLSVTMEHMLMQYFIYARTLIFKMSSHDKAVLSLDSIIFNKLRALEANPCSNKKEGKAYFEQFKAEFFKLLLPYLY